MTLTAYQNELLTILSEECAETIQEVCKIQRFGIDSPSHHYTDGRSHLVCLHQEIGDILAVVDLLVESGIKLSTSELLEAKYRKLEKLKLYMTHAN